MFKKTIPILARLGELTCFIYFVAVFILEISVSRPSNITIVGLLGSLASIVSLSSIFSKPRSRLDVDGMKEDELKAMERCAIVALDLKRNEAKAKATEDRIEQLNLLVVKVVLVHFKKKQCDQLKENIYLSLKKNKIDHLIHDYKEKRKEIQTLSEEYEVDEDVKFIQTIIEETALSEEFSYDEKIALSMYRNVRRILKRYGFIYQL